MSLQPLQIAGSVRQCHDNAKADATPKYLLHHPISIIMPCLNEAETLEFCILEAQAALTEAGIEGEIVIADNGSSDGSQQIARRLGARVADVAERGYGAALQGGIAAAHGQFIVMGERRRQEAKCCVAACQTR